MKNGLTRVSILTLGLLALAETAWADPTIAVKPSTERTLRLPETPFGYADVSLPALIRAADAVHAVRGGYSGTFAAAPAHTNVRLSDLLPRGLAVLEGVAEKRLDSIQGEAMPLHFPLPAAAHGAANASIAIELSLGYGLPVPRLRIHPD